MRIKYRTHAIGICLFGLGGWISGGCSVVQNTPSASSAPPSDPSEIATASPNSLEPRLGILKLTANGEALVQEGLVSRDGWAIAFDHVYLTVEDVIVSQQKGTPSKTTEATTQTVSLVSDPITVDLVTPQEESRLVLVETQTVPVGYYNDLDWSITPTAESGAKQSGLRLIGTATKENQIIAFDLNLTPEHRYTCGAFIGDSRKGFVAENDPGEVEMTIHMDHLFGDGSLPADEAINQDSLGFGPFAAIAQSSTLVMDQDDLQADLSAADYDTLSTALLDMGHVGEGHCTATDLKE